MSGFAGQVLARFPESLPRYTSYPSANHFGVADEASLAAMVTAAAAADSVSLYIHIPFCDRLCWFCGCHTKHTLRYEPVQAFVRGLLAEIALWRQALSRKPRLSRLHLGGGSPSMLRRPELQQLRAALDDSFGIDELTEISVEVDPSDVQEDTLAALRDFGMTRASIGVQDFDPVVQAAINRPQSFDLTRRVVEDLRKAGIASVNIDALYGLPLQTGERLRRSMEMVLALAPDRIALFGYAHVPWMKPHQKLINDADLPGSADRFAHAQMAAGMIGEAGYTPIGIDHFALPHDSLARTAAAGRLRRNFQGYTDDDAPVLIGLGPSAIGRHAGGYVQNTIATGAYLTSVFNGRLPCAKGLTLTADDLLRGWLIERLMCDYKVSLSQLPECFAPHAADTQALVQAVAASDVSDLCSFDGDCLEVVAAARPFVRIVAARFDAWLESGPRRYSKAV